jgi:hypothetical protein
VIAAFIEVGERIIKMAHFEDQMKQILYRRDCPSSVELGDYQLGMLPEGRMAFIRKHLAECPHCTREVEMLQSFLRDLQPDLEYSLEERIKVLIAERLSGLSTGGQAMPAFGLRGEAEDVHIYQVENVQISVHLERDPKREGHYSLFGLVTGIEPEGVAAHLWRGGEEVGVAGLDELGNFIFSSVETGLYELMLSGPELEILIQNLTID